MKFDDCLKFVAKNGDKLSFSVERGGMETARSYGKVQAEKRAAVLAEKREKLHKRKEKKIKAMRKALKNGRLEEFQAKNSAGYEAEMNAWNAFCKKFNLQEDIIEGDEKPFDAN